MKDIAFQCAACDEWVPSSPTYHIVNWCLCGKLGVNDHSQPYGVRVVGIASANRIEGIIKMNGEVFKKHTIDKLSEIKTEMPTQGEYIGE